jgi:hypothetical protein
MNGNTTVNVIHVHYHVDEDGDAYIPPIPYPNPCYLQDFPPNYCSDPPRYSFEIPPCPPRCIDPPPPPVNGEPQVSKCCSFFLKVLFILHFYSTFFILILHFFYLFIFYYSVKSAVLVCLALF